MSYVNISYDKILYTAETININNFDLSVSGKKLLTNSKLSLSSGSIYGLIGKNGSGKSSLLKKLIELKPESSNSMNISTLYVEQEIELDERYPVDFVLNSNYKHKKCQEEFEKLNKLIESEESDKMEHIEYELIADKARELGIILSVWNPDIERSKVIKILLGLGFTEEDLTKSSNFFSGGWQMRISLARALYLEPDLLLLDEPTNHLDLEAIIWLGDYLNELNNTVIVVSHNIGFLNEICDYILNIEDSKQLVQYKGNYYGFKQALKIKHNSIVKEWEKYDKKLKDLKKKGTDKTKIKAFISKNEVTKPEKPYNVSIDFYQPFHINSNLINMTNMSFGYSPDKPILSNIDIGLDMNSKIILVGPNGSGKSTLVNLMLGDIKPTSGEVLVNNQSRFGYYSQHFENQLPLIKTPIQYLQMIIPKEFIKDGMVEQSVRSYLGQVKLEPNAHNKPIGELSGGQKARVAIIKLIFLQPHVLILDEPTNHLDIETVESLINALVNFKGGILVITHEPELIEKLNGTIWMMEQVPCSTAHTINRKIESYKQYCELILDN
jgi:ATP-binding cassette, subfamily F, member 1